MESETVSETALKIAIVDNEPDFLDELTQLCHDFGAQNHCPIQTTPFASGEAFLNAFANGEFSIVFMDIYMDEMDGIAAALQMRSLDSRCLLIFVTSSREFMPEAFSCHAFEYITKPVSAKRVFTVLHDALKVLPKAAIYIEITSGRRTIPVFLHDIAFAVTDAHYLQIGLTDGTSIKSRMTLTAFLQQIEHDPRFITVNKGITLNAEYITDFEDNCCILENGSRFPVRVRDCLKIEQAVQDYNFSKIRERQNTYQHSVGKGEHHEY